MHTFLNFDISFLNCETLFQIINESYYINLIARVDKSLNSVISVILKLNKILNI